jgi:hypothetical protein
MDVSCQFHGPATLSPQGYSPQYPLDRKLRGLEAGLDAMETREISYTSSQNEIPIPWWSSPYPSRYTSWAVS